MANAIKDYLSAQWWAIADCADAYESQCGSDFPDLRSFSGRLAPADRAAGLAELVKIELERRWKSGTKKQIEDYLRDFPELKDPSVSLDDLVAQEYLVRARYGDPPTMDELQSRFPSVDVGKVLPPGQDLLGTVALGDAKIETRRSVSDDSPPGTDGTIVYDTQKSKSSGGSTVGESNSAGAASGSTPAASGSAPATSKSAAATPAQPAAALTGSIGRYVIRQQLGAGSFGVVLRCTDEDLKRDVAIKLPHRTGASSAERVKEFLHEAQSAARLRHPGIVTVLNTGLSDDGRVYIVYEFIRGTTLQSRLDEGEYSLEDVVRWVAGTAEALHHAHKNAIVHRDIKPANILLDEDSQPHIADFGLAKMDDHFFKNDAGRVLGTAAYMSPEQANGQSHWASPQTDIYSVGVMLYQMLTKRLPFGGRTLSEMLEQVKDRVPSPPRTIDDKIPKPLEDVCLRAMAKNPADRYSTAADMAADLRAALGGAPPARRGRWLVGALSGAAALGGVALMLIFGRGHDDRTKPPDGTQLVAPAAPVPGVTATGLEPAIPAAPSTPILDVIYQPYAAQGVYHSLRIKDVLHWKDKVKFHVTLGVPRYVYLFWYDVNGKSEPVWPTDFAHQEKTKQVDYPPKGEWEEIDNQHGAEFLLVAARDKPLEGDELAQFEKQLPYAKNDIRVDAVYPVGSKDLSRGLAGIVKSREDPLEPDFKTTLDKTFESYHGFVIPHQ